MNESWHPRFYEGSPLFDPLRAAAARLAGTQWPDAGALQRALDARGRRVLSGGGAPIHFVPQAPKTAHFEEGYEPRIYLRGEVQVRNRNWHDLFNALVWMTFPLAKAALNARHYHAVLARRESGQPNRSPVQDALTLFDESGLVVAAADSGLLRKVETFAWRELFWDNRRRVASAMRFHVFGHSVYEKALNPFRGITARAILMDVAPELCEAGAEEQLAWLDAALARRIGDPGALISTRVLAPVPVLGIPGWHPSNAFAEYYDDARHFRPGRRRA